MAYPYKDLTGQKFGKLTVEKLVRREENGKYIWLCKCDCGKEREVWGRALTKGVATSCNSRNCRKSGHRKGNTYEFYENFIIGYDSKGNEFYIDKDDYEEVSKHTWLMTDYGYFSAYIPGSCTKNNHVLLHRYLLGMTDSSIFVDHINHCRHDCRRCNLKIVTQQENMQNVLRPEGGKGHNNDPYVQAIRKFIIRDHPEFGEFKTAKDASDFYQRYLIDQLNVRKIKEG